MYFVSLVNVTGQGTAHLVRRTLHPLVRRFHLGHDKGLYLLFQPVAESVLLLFQVEMRL